MSLQNWIWYPRLLKTQLGANLLIIGISGLILLILLNHINHSNISINDKQSKDNYSAWKWLIINLVIGWIFTSLSPNKDSRYIAPLLPAIVLLLSRGWLQWGLWAKTKFPRLSKAKTILFLFSGVASIIPAGWDSQSSLLSKVHNGPIEKIIQDINKKIIGQSKQTIIVVPSTPDLNQHNVSYFGRRNGMNIVGRQLGNNDSDIQPVLDFAKWVLLAEGDQGSVRSSAANLDNAVRQSGIFKKINDYSRANLDSYSLWKRLPTALRKRDFTTQFSKLAIGLGDGPKAFESIFEEIATQHMLDGHMLYQKKIKEQALINLEKNPNHINSHWDLALLAILKNRPKIAAKQFAILEKLLPSNPWPSVYHSAVTLIDWNPWKAAKIAKNATKKHNNPVLIALEDISKLMGGAIWTLPKASTSVSDAIQFVERRMGESQEQLSN